jgi:hypothetical protein
MPLEVGKTFYKQKSNLNKIIITIILFLTACSSGVKPDLLIGKWQYVSYEYQNKSLNKPLANIVAQQPYIVFHANGTAAIYSSGKVLSSGNYKLEGKIIRFVEDLPNNQKRKIPFLIQELTNKTLVFQTMDSEVKVITAEMKK